MLISIWIISVALEAGSHDAQSSECTKTCLQRAVRALIMFAVMAACAASLRLLRQRAHGVKTTGRQQQSAHTFNSRSQCCQRKPWLPTQLQSICDTMNSETRQKRTWQTIECKVVEEDLFSWELFCLQWQGGVLNLRLQCVCSTEYQIH